MSTGPARRTRTGVVVVTVLAVLLLASCAPGANELVSTPPPGAEDPAGFWLGLWHGFIAPITVIVSIFNKSVGIYEPHNIGIWYDIPFVVGISIFFNGLAQPGRAARSSRKRDRRR